jgi:hypothetical protein
VYFVPRHAYGRAVPDLSLIWGFSAVLAICAEGSRGKLLIFLGSQGFESLSEDSYRTGPEIPTPSDALTC